MRQAAAADIQLRYGELFAGMGLATKAIKSVFGEKPECAFYSEINQSCIKVYGQHNEGHENIGDISYMDEEEAKKLPEFDFLIGGSPCNDLSIARGQREGLDGEQSGLFYAYLDVKRTKKPKYFLLENVASMSEEDRDEISEKLGVEPVEISSVYFTGQDRKRLYWANFPIPRVPTVEVDPRKHIDKTDKPKLTLADATKQKIEDGEELNLHTIRYNGELKTKEWLAKHKSDWDWVTWTRSTRYPEFNTKKEMTDFVTSRGIQGWKTHKPKKKKFAIKYVEQRIKINSSATTLVTGMGCARFSSRNLIRQGNKCRPINKLECARLQGIPDGYIQGLSPSAEYAAIGNAFTLPVIEHILAGLKEHIRKTT